MTTTQLPVPTELPTTATTLVGDYPTYAAAQQAVDYLSDHGFPVQHATIVGADLRLVETVTRTADRRPRRWGRVPAAAPGSDCSSAQSSLC